jgi:hypothetical protein
MPIDQYEIMACPVSGFGTFMKGGSPSQAEAAAGWESLATAAVFQEAFNASVGLAAGSGSAAAATGVDYASSFFNAFNSEYGSDPCGGGEIEFQKKW